MSSVPKTNKPKYNNSDAFRWVDAQWEKFMTEQKELKSKIEDLENEIEQLKQDYYFDIIYFHSCYGKQKHLVAVQSH